MANRIFGYLDFGSLVFSSLVFGSLVFGYLVLFIDTYSSTKEIKSESERSSAVTAKGAPPPPPPPPRCRRCTSQLEYYILRLFALLSATFGCIKPEPIHQPIINHSSTTHQPFINHSSTINQPLINH